MNTNDWSQLLQQMSILNSSVAGAYSKLIIGVAALKILAAIVCLLMGAIFFLCYRSGRRGGVGLVIVGLSLWSVVDVQATVVVRLINQSGARAWYGVASGASCATPPGPQGVVEVTTNYTQLLYYDAPACKSVYWYTNSGGTGGVKQNDTYSPTVDGTPWYSYFTGGGAGVTNWVTPAFTWTNTYGRIMNYEIVGWTNGVPFATNTIFLVPGADYTVPAMTNGSPYSLSVESTLDWESPLVHVWDQTATEQSGGSHVETPVGLPIGGAPHQNDPAATMGGQPSSWNIPTNAAIADRQNANAIVQAVAAGASQNAFLLSNVVAALGSGGGNWLTGMVSVTGTNTNGFSGTTLSQGLTNYAARSNGGWAARAAPSIVVPLSQFDPGIGLEDYTWNWGRTDENGIDQTEWDTWITTMRAVILVLETIAAGYGGMRALMWAVS